MDSYNNNYNVQYKGFYKFPPQEHIGTKLNEDD